MAKGKVLALTIRRPHSDWGRFFIAHPRHELGHHRKLFHAAAVAVGDVLAMAHDPVDPVFLHAVGWVAQDRQSIVVAEALKESSFENLAVPLVSRADDAGGSRIAATGNGVVTECVPSSRINGNRTAIEDEANPHREQKLAEACGDQESQAVQLEQ
jgi:hypothetical protein